MAAMEIGSMAAQISPVTRTNSASRRVSQSIARTGSWAPPVSRRNLVVRSVKTSDANAKVADLASPNGVVNPVSSKNEFKALLFEMYSRLNACSS